MLLGLAALVTGVIVFAWQPNIGLQFPFQLQYFAIWLGDAALVFAILTIALVYWEARRPAGG